MNDRAGIDWATRLCHQEQRSVTLRELAQDSGAHDALLLVRDKDSDAMLPVLGARQTLPRGPGWRALLHAVREPGLFRSEVEALHGAGAQAVLAHSDGGIALVLVGGSPNLVVLEALQPLWALLRTTLACEQHSRAIAGELRTARTEMRQYAAQAKVLDETRLKLDETARQRAEHARRAEDAGRAKDEFLAMLGHELRNPLSPIVTSLEVLRLRGKWQPELDVIKRQVRHMERLVEDLLDISRIARGKLFLEKIPLDLADVLARARESVPDVGHKRESLIWDVPASGLPVSGDASRLVQVFANLLGNAVKYSDSDSLIRVHARAEEGCVHVSIHDKGIGLAPSQLEQIFEMFEQGGHSSAFASGLGLGLAIVRNLVRHHDGRVWAESPGPGLGSTFHVSLPLTVSVRVSPTPSAIPTVDIGGARVMVVDDNIDVLTTLTWMLQLSGCAVLGVESGAEALAKAQAFRADVAVLDLGMPEMDGLTLARQLRTNLGKATPQLVALTGFGQHADRARAKEAGFNAFLVKPVDPEELMKTILLLRQNSAVPGI